MVYHRWENGGAGDDVVVVVNLSHKAYGSYRIGLPREGTWYVRFNGDSRNYSPDFSDFPGDDTQSDSYGSMGMPYSANVGIGPYSSLILSQ